MDTARINLGYTRVTAPITGRIGKSSFTDGALVTAYQAVSLATIQQLDPIYVDVPQSTSELLRLKRRLQDGRLNQNGMDQSKVKLILEDDANYPMEGTFLFRDVTVDPTTGSVVLRLVFPNPEGVLLPGMFVQSGGGGRNKRSSHSYSTASSITRSKGESHHADRGSSRRESPTAMLALDRAIGDNWLISSGLASGDRVIVEGMQKIRPGVSVKVVPWWAPRES